MLNVDQYFTVVKPVYTRHENGSCCSDCMCCTCKSTNGIIVIFSIISKLEDYIGGMYSPKRTL